MTTLEFSPIQDDNEVPKSIGKIYPSGLFKLLESPEKFRQPIDRTDDMDFGTVVDAMLLPNGEPSPFIEIPAEVLSKSGARSGGAWEAFKAAHAGKILLKSAEVQRAKQVCEAVMSVPIIREHLEATGNQFQARRKAHVTSEQGEYTYSAVMSAKLDVLNPNFVIDLKVHGREDLNKFLRSAEFDMGYHLQGAAYQYLQALQDGEELPVYLVVVESDGLMRADMVEITPSRLELGHKLFMRATEDWFRRTVTGDWHRETYNRIVKW